MSVQNEFSSFKLLLKQVYSAHSTKVKELENEIKHLKEKLTEKERKTNDSITDCKRCIELEEAFKTCKRTLHEQSKLFESFGQKFSIFNSSELEHQELKDVSKLSSYAPEAAKISSSLKKNSAHCDKNESSVILQEKDVVIQNHENRAEKLSISSSNQNLLKNVMLDDEASFDVYTVTFNENLKHDKRNIKSDSIILAPDSLCTALDVQKVSEAGLKVCSLKEGEKNRNILKSVEGESSKIVETNYKDSKITRKRLSSETLNESRLKRSNIGDLSESNSETSKTIQNISSIIIPKIVASESHISENVVSIIKATTDSSTKNIQKSTKKSAVEITASKDSKNETSKNSASTINLVNDVKNKGILNQTSPSLLPTHLNIPPKIIDLEPISNDDDFQELIPNSKIQYGEDCWGTCDRKKLLKKSQNLRCIKSTSKYKMTLDAPPLNYKKPTYKQTKLSKSIFQCKSTDSSKKSPQESKLSKNNLSPVRVEEEYFPSVLQDHFQSSTPRDTVRFPVVDIDATFIPENFKLESPQYNTTNVKKNTVENSNLKNGSLFSNISFPEEFKSSIKNVENSSMNEDDIKDFFSPKDLELKENMNSFDRLPLPEEPAYKYKNDVVRKKAERRQLNGFDCKECEKYYSDLGLTDKEKKERMKKCSRHRGKYSPPATPEHFWELDFPDTEECKARGYLNETQKVNLNNICDI